MKLIVRFDVFTAVTMKMSSSGMWRCVDPGLSDVSEERTASIFRVENSARGEPASARCCRLRHIPEDDVLHETYFFSFPSLSFPLSLRSIYAYFVCRPPLNFTFIQNDDNYVVDSR
jgi:hypothetical protein